MPFPAIITASETTDLSRPLRRRDALMNGDADGVRFGADLGWPWGYPAQANPANGTLIRDHAERADGKVVLGAGQALAFQGNGLRFAAVTAAGTYIEIPASVAADIFANGQRFLVWCYVALPSEADWNSAASVAPFLSFADSNSGYTNGADLVTIAQRLNGGVKSITAIRQRDTNVADFMAITPAANDYGSFAQIAFWRNAAGQGLRLKTANNTQVTTAAVGADNARDFSALTGKIGLGPSFWPFVVGPSPNARRWSAYRCFVENLTRSARDPIATLDADWARLFSNPYRPMPFA